MSLLKTADPGKTTGEMERIYQTYRDDAGTVPPSLLMCSTSPGIQAVQAQTISYYKEESGLGLLLMALIKYLTAVALELHPCVEYNARVLTGHGLTEEQIADLRINPAAAPLEEKDGWLLAFVIKAVRAPETVSEGHVRKLRELGWTDSQIFDALNLSCMMVGMERMMKALKFE